LNRKGLPLRHAPRAPTDDETLLARAISGDERAFGELVRRHVRSATLLAAQIVGERDAAEDIVQDAFLIVNDGARSFDYSRPFAPWFFGVVRRLAIDAQKREARRRRLWTRWGTREADLTTFEPNEATLDSAQSRKVEDALNTLSPMQRACFELVSVKQIAISSVAAMHDIAESTVRQHVYRARKALQRSLRKDLP
jgi:RNA polymerase sigma-70 factor (ECF subfamily)